jgi:hypothetical protein
MLQRYVLHPLSLAYGNWAKLGFLLFSLNLSALRELGERAVLSPTVHSCIQSRNTRSLAKKFINPGKFQNLYAINQLD